MRACFLTDFVQVCTKFVSMKMSVLTTYLSFDVDLRFPLSCAFFTTVGVLEIPDTFLGGER